MACHCACLSSFIIYKGRAKRKWHNRSYPDLAPKGLTKKICAEDRGALLKQLFGYMLGPSVQGAATSYQEYPLPPAVRL